MSVNKWTPLTPEEIKYLVAEICEPDHEAECAALQVLMRDVLHSVESPERVVDIAWQVSIAARATFDDVMDDRAQDLREQIFSHARYREIVQRACKAMRTRPRG